MPHRRRMPFAFAALLLLNANATAQRHTRPRPVTESNTGARAAGALRLVANRVSLSGGKSFVLDLPDGFAVSVAAQGLKRVRFMSESPDGRIFVTDMHDLTDNS